MLFQNMKHQQKNVTFAKKSSRHEKHRYLQTVYLARQHIAKNQENEPRTDTTTMD